MTDVIAFPDRAKTVDENAWLEDIYGESQLEWVAAENAKTAAMFDTPEFAIVSARILDVLDSTERIPFVAKHGAFFYNLWKDADHPRGLWRRTMLESYRTADPEWDVVLDIDELGRAENAEWVFAGAQFLAPDNTRALLRLSPDGGDAVTIREFDLESRTFIDNGFVIPTAKTSTSWIDADSIFIASDFGPGTLTTSSYPRQVRKLRRGQSLADAEVVFEIPEDHMITVGVHDHTVGFERDLVVDTISFFSRQTYLLQNGTPVAIDVPTSASIELHREWLLVRPRFEWEVGGSTYPAGSLLATKLDAFLSGERTFEVLFTPDAQSSLRGWSWTKNHLLLELLRDVSSQIEVLTPGESGWSRSLLAAAPVLHSASVSGVDDDENDDYWLTISGFLTPETLKLGTIGSDDAETLKSAPSFFDESKFTLEQHFVVSKDGTRVPYFQIAPRDLVLDGGHPTLLYGYGGFEISRTPSYSGGIGRGWLERGGVYVVANIRGGGEYGPTWHTAALRENRHRAYEDFAAVAEDLIARGVTSAEHLGCEGGSNGGLLVGNMLTLYPHLFGAIACEVPLLDMQRYTKLSAGYSWIAEYGDPDVPEDWEFIQTFSPYHNLRDGVEYPATLFYTATSDDRVGPVQARKMYSRMLERGIPDVWFYENREGGHGGGADNKQLAHMRASAYVFLWDRLTS
ncbi:prolyl oligopeptidase family serine peptidase [soil metagenome]